MTPLPVMTTPIIPVISLPAGPIAQSPTTPAPANNLWFMSSGALAVLLVAGGVYFKLETDKLQKRIRAEEFRVRELKKRLDLALKSIHKMEANPDLVNSREFNLDYLRMRMQEEIFHFAIVNQIKMKIKTMVSVALRPTQQQAGNQNNAQTNQGRQVDQLFDVEYETCTDGVKRVKRVLFRVQVRITKLPTQPTSRTIEEIINCLERYLSLADDDDDRWQPTIQGRIVTISWDQKAKPTPLLVLEQSGEGMNVTLKTRRAAGAAK
jgi:hypothetical protein